MSSAKGRLFSLGLNELIYDDWWPSSLKIACCLLLAIIWTSDDLLLIRPLETNFKEIWIKICFCWRKLINWEVTPMNLLRVELKNCNMSKIAAILQMTF